MGCGCKGNKTKKTDSRIDPTNSLNTIEGKQQATAKASTVTAASTVQRVCMRKYQFYKKLEQKTSALYDKFKTDEDKAKKLKETSVILRGWIVKLNKGCPDEIESQKIEEYINGEYTRYFTTGG